MPSLAEALESALKGTKGLEILNPAERAAQKAASKTAPAGVAPTVPEVAPPVATPSGGAPPSQGPGSDPNAAAQTPAAGPPAAPVPADAGLPAQAPTDIAIAPAAGPAAPPPPEPTIVPTAEPAAPAAPPAPPPGARIARIDPVSGKPILRLPDGTEQPAPSPTPQDKALAATKAQLPDFEGRLNERHLPNTDVMIQPDQIKAVILQVADENKEAIAKAQSVTKPDDQLIGLAHDFNSNNDTMQLVLNRQLGNILENPHLLYAARLTEAQLFANYRVAAEAVARGTATPQDIVAFVNAERQLGPYLAEMMGMKSQAGELLHVAGIPAGPTAELTAHTADLLKRTDLTMQQRAKAVLVSSTNNGAGQIALNQWAFVPMWKRALVTLPQNIMQRVFINGILSGASLFRILIGNTTNMLKHQLELEMVGMSNQATHLAASMGQYPMAPERISMFDAYAHMHGMMNAMSDSWRVAMKVVRHDIRMDDITGTSRMGETAGRAGSATLQELFPEANGTILGSLARALDVFFDAPGRVIGGADAFTRNMGQRGWQVMRAIQEARVAAVRGTVDDKGNLVKLDPNMVNEYVAKKAVDPSKSVEKEGYQWGSRFTFQTPFYTNPETGAPGAMAKASEAVANSPFGWARFLFPFLKTPYNIAAQGISESYPVLNLFSARMRAMLSAGGDQRQQAFARMAMGTSVGGLAAWAALHGKCTGGLPRDPHERAIWEQQGIQPYSMLLPKYGVIGPDTYFSYASLEPVATQVGLICDGMRLKSYIAQHSESTSMKSHDQLVTDAMAHVLASLMENLGNKAMMQGAGQFAETWTDPMHFLKSTGANLLGAEIPYSGALKVARKLTDPYLRQAGSLLEQVENALPHFSKGLYMRPDWYGQPRTNPGILGSLIPFAVKEKGADPVTDEIKRVMDLTSTAPVGMPSNRMSMGAGDRGIEGGQGYTLTDGEYADFVQRARAEPQNGSTYHEKMEKMINSPMYQKMTPTQQSDMLRLVTTEADTIGRMKLLANNEGFRSNLKAWQARERQLATGK